ncbi:type II toxin-antitoxin system Phd/YefM family antitoxin, partial [Vibrio alginolyticus]|nr:type II toxin-antitoxin system Phd/YefM family antitoxin [Vibrio alginolyticus]
MQTVTSHEFRTNFRENIEFAKYREPIATTQYGHPAVVLLSYEEAVNLLNIKEKVYSNERVPNELTRQAMQELNDDRQSRHLKRYDNVEAMIADIQGFEE